MSMVAPDAEGVDVGGEVLSCLAAGSNDPKECGYRLARLLVLDRRRFQTTAARYLASGDDPAGAGPLARVLDEHDLLPDLLLDPSLCSDKEAAAAARVVKRHVDQIDLYLARRLGTARGEQARRILVLLAEITDSNRVLPLLTRVFRDQSSELRTEAARIFARHCRNTLFVENALKDPNPDVRAGAIEGMGLSGGDSVPSVLVAALHDPNHQVQAQAVLACHRRGDKRALDIVRRMAKQPRPKFRESAAWLIGRIQEESLHPLLLELRHDSNMEVRSEAEQALRDFAPIRSRAEPLEAAVQVPLKPLDLDLVFSAADAAGRRSMRCAILDSRGEEVTDLSEESFQLKRGREAVSAEVEAPGRRRPININWVLDCSGSMTASDIQEMDGAVIRSFVHKRESDCMGVYKFAMNVECAAVLTAKVERAAAAVMRAHQGLRNSSRLLDALWNALAALADKKGFGAVIAVADGADRGSDKTISEVVQQAVSAAAPLYMIGFHVTHEKGPLAELAQRTGGRCLLADNAAELRAACTLIMRRLANHYVLNFEAAVGDEGDLRLRAAGASGMLNKTVKPMSA